MRLILEALKRIEAKGSSAQESSTGVLAPYRDAPASPPARREAAPPPAYAPEEAVGERIAASPYADDTAPSKRRDEAVSRSHATLSEVEEQVALMAAQLAAEAPPVPVEEPDLSLLRPPAVLVMQPSHDEFVAASIDAPAGRSDDFDAAVQMDAAAEELPAEVGSAAPTVDADEEARREAAEREAPLLKLDLSQCVSRSGSVKIRIPALATSGAEERAAGEAVETPPAERRAEAGEQAGAEEADEFVAERSEPRVEAAFPPLAEDEAQTEAWIAERTAFDEREVEVRELEVAETAEAAFGEADEGRCEIEICEPGLRADESSGAEESLNAIDALLYEADDSLRVTSEPNVESLFGSDEAAAEANDAIGPSDEELARWAAETWVAPVPAEAELALQAAEEALEDVGSGAAGLEEQASAEVPPREECVAVTRREEAHDEQPLVEPASAAEPLRVEEFPLFQQGFQANRLRLPPAVDPAAYAIRDEISKALGSTAPAAVALVHPRQTSDHATVVLGLAVAFAAKTSADVLAIDGGASLGGLSTEFEMPRQPGLREALCGIDWTRACHDTGVPRLWIMPRGGIAIPSGSHLTDSVLSLVAELKRRFRYVLLDVSASSDRTLVEALAVACDAAAVVVGIDETERSEAVETIELLRAKRCRILGCIAAQPSE